MRKIALILVILLAVPPLSFAGNVKGYWRDSDGDGVKDTYVEPHQRTNPNRSRMDNYSHPGNYNQLLPNYQCACEQPRLGVLWWGPMAHVGSADTSFNSGI